LPDARFSAMAQDLSVRRHRRKAEAG
jgi:hypothetical protein